MPRRADDPPAVTLLRDAAGLERALLAGMVHDPASVDRLGAVTWEDVGPKVLAPTWERAVRANPEAFGTLTVAGVADVAAQIGTFEESLRSEADQGLDAKARRRRAIWCLGAGLGHALLRSGWRVESLPGEPIRLRRDGETIEPFDAAARLVEGTLSAEAWKDLCERLRIGEIALA